MPENAKEQIKRIDTLDQKEDKKVSLIAGKEEELTETYVTKTEELLSKTDELDNDDPEKQKVKDDLTNLLKEIDEKTLTEKEKEFRGKIDEFMEKTEGRVDVQARIKALEFSSWKEFGADMVFAEAYGELMKNGTEITEDNILALEDYANATQELGTRHQDSMAYFLDGKVVETADDDVLRTYTGKEKVKQILTGEIKNPDELTKEFSARVGGLEAKKKECEKLGASIYMGLKNSQIAEIYIVLVEQNGFTLEEISLASQKIFTREDLVKNLRKDKEEFKNFLIEAVLRGEKDENVLDKMEAEQSAKVIFEKRQKELKSQLGEAKKEVEEAQAEMEKFKKEIEAKYKAGLYCHMGVMEGETYSSSTTAIAGESSETVEKYNFRVLMNAEKDFSEAGAELMDRATRMEENEAMYTMALYKINNGGEKTAAQEFFPENFDEAKYKFFDENLGAKTGQFSEIERLRAETLTQEKSAEEKAEICQDEGLLKKELKYRQSFENGEAVDEETREYIRDKKYKELERMAKEKNALKEAIARESGIVEKAISDCGSIDLVPPDQKPTISDKAITLMKLLGSSLDCMDKSVMIETELMVINKEMPEKTIKERDKEMYESQKKLLEETGKFLSGEEIKFEEPDPTSPELTLFIYSNLKGIVESRANEPMGRYGEAARRADININSQLQRVDELRAFGVTKMDVLNNCTKSLDDMMDAFMECKAQLLGAKECLDASLQSDFFKAHPELKEQAQEIVDGLKKEIDQTLKEKFSAEKWSELARGKEALETAKDDMFWDVVKMAAVLVGTVAISMATAGIGGAIAGRLLMAGRVISIGGRALTIGARGAGAAHFVGENVGIAAGLTVGSRAMKEATVILPGSDTMSEEVDWSAGSLYEDFKVNLALSFTFTGALKGLGQLKNLAGKGNGVMIRELIKTGGEATGVELAEAGLAGTGVAKSLFGKLANRFGRAGAEEAVEVEAKIARDLGKKFVKDTVKDEAKKEIEAVAVGEEHDKETEPKIIETIAGNLKEKKGMEIVENAGVMEFSAPSAKEFGMAFNEELGKTKDMVDTWINDGKPPSFSFRVKGTNKVTTIYPSKTKIIT